MKYNDNGTYEDIVIKAIAPGRNNYSTSQQEVYSCNYTNSAIQDAVTESKSYTDNVDAKNNYSTTEQVIGTWIDGKPIYRKVIYISSFPSSNSETYDIGATIGVGIRVYGFCIISGNNIFMPLNLSRPGAYDGILSEIGCWIENNQVKIEVGKDRSSASGYVIVEYTKATD